LKLTGGKELNSTEGYQIYTKIEGTSICELDIKSEEFAWFDEET